MTTPTSVQLRFSNSTQRLLEEMLEAVRSGGSGESSLRDRVAGGTTLIFPNGDTEEWFLQQLTLRRGVTLGVGTEKLEGYLRKALLKELAEGSEKQSETPFVPPELLTASILEQWSATALERVLKGSDPIYAPLRRYLFGKEKSDSKGEVRRIGLIRRLSRLFLEYELNRPGVYGADGELTKPGVAESWCNPGDNLYFGKKNGSGEVEKTERWQRELFREIFGEEPGVVRDQKGSRIWATLPALYRMAMAQRRTTKRSGPFGQSVAARKILLFSPLGLSHFHRQLLYNLPHQLTVFQLNPCSEFWEDVKHSWRYRRSEGQKKLPILHFESEQRSELFERPSLGETGLFPGEENRLLDLWGEESKESVTLWCQASNYDFEFATASSAEPDLSGESLLRTLKQRLLMRTPDSEREKRSFGDDRSLQFYSAPTRLRETEALRDRIVELLKENRTWKLSDIAVMVPDLEGYRGAIHRVFASPRSDHHSLVEQPFAIALEDEVKNRSDTVAALRTLFRMIKAKKPGRSLLLEFLRNPKMQQSHGLTPEMLEAWEGWIDRLGLYGGDAADVHGWKRGADRLLLAAMSDTVWEKGEIPLYPFTDFGSGDEKSLALFAGIPEALEREIEALHCDLAEKEPATQFELLRIFIDRWLQPRFIDETEQRLVSQLNVRMREIALQSAAGRKTVPVDELIRHLESMLHSEIASFGAPPGALRFITPKAGAVPPRKAIFWLGLNGGIFPGRDDDSPMDLLTQKRILGDRSGVAQRKFTFLESILAASETIHFSWLGEDVQKQSELHPSSTVAELISYLNDTVSEKPVEVEKIPLEPMMPLSQKEAADILSRHRAKTESSGGDNGDRDPTSSPPPDSIPTRVHLDISELALWLNSPYDYSLRKRFRFYNNRDEDIATQEREPLQSDSLDNWRLREQFLEEAIPRLLRSEPVDPSKLYDRVLQKNDEIGHGITPPLRPFRKELAEVKKFESYFSDPITNLLKVTGPLFEPFPVSKTLPLGGERELTGTFSTCLESENRLILRLISGSELSLNRPDKLMEPILFALLLRASSEEREIFLLPFGKEGMKQEALLFRLAKGMSSQEARELLEKLFNKVLAGDPVPLPLLAEKNFFSPPAKAKAPPEQQVSTPEEWERWWDEQSGGEQYGGKYRISEGERLLPPEAPDEGKLKTYFNEVIQKLAAAIEPVGPDGLGKSGAKVKGESDE